MKITDAERRMIEEDLKTQSLSKVARNYQIPLSDVMQIAGVYKDAGNQRYSRVEVDNPNLSPFIVSVRHRHKPWPLKDMKSLQQAREDYDAGLVEMVQGRQGEYIVQYAIPRLHRANKRRYFSSMEVMN